MCRVDQFLLLGILLVMNPHLARASTYEAKCVMDPADSAGLQKVGGTIRLRQEDAGPVFIGVRLTGFDPTDLMKKHGFHIHENGDPSEQCRHVGDHYNPEGKQHGAPEDEDRHVGDLGNLIEENDGQVNIVLKDSIITLTNLSTRYNILGRTMVLHRERDDLGRGGQFDSLITGHSGRKIACCQIVAAEESDFREASCEMTGIGADSTQRITGKITIKQLNTGGMTTYDMHLSGFNATVDINEYSFRVHQKGSTGNLCLDAGGSYNPSNVSHEGARQNRKNAGELWNIKKTHGHMPVVKTINDVGSGLLGNTNIVNRTIVVHSIVDDLGADDTNGIRIGCCIITIRNKHQGRLLSSATIEIAGVYILVLGLICSFSISFFQILE